MSNERLSFVRQITPINVENVQGLPDSLCAKSSSAGRIAQSYDPSKIPRQEQLRIVLSGQRKSGIEMNRCGWPLLRHNPGAARTHAGFSMNSR